MRSLLKMSAISFPRTPQIDALEAAACSRMYEEKESGGRWDRPEQHRLLDRLSQVDVLVVWKPDRLSRSLKDLLLILKMIEEAGAGFRSLTEAIDTTIPAGRMMMHMLGSFAEFERAAIRERTQAGLSAARAQGRRGGHRPKLKPNNAPKSLPCWMLAGQPPMSAGCFESTAPPSAACDFSWNEDPV
ncbi:recombinase family protein [Aliihoeflea sp. 40Bstr573]|uniref:recombinase family protein n=1 Tax=Aliihoeflea sp. 40Bstr573 TaxID=2696467 RepID=UPI00353190BF